MADRPGKLSTAWKVGRIAGRRLLGRKVGEKDHALTQSLAESLDQMKGLAMKVGQIVSYMDVPLPEELQSKLSVLQTGSVGRPANELASVFEASLGASPDELFDELEQRPVAAASIGQVHHARFQGREVAVKVQYPEVAGSFADDLSLLHRLAGLASLGSSVDGRAMVGELAARLEEECDYEREARFQEAFARSFAHDPGVRIPSVIHERSGPQILTTEWLAGRDFASFVAGATDEERQRAARTLVRFSYRSLLTHGVIQADPHPGNFAFPEEGGVVFYDFGCVRDIGSDLRDALRALAAAMVAGDRTAAREAAVAMGVVGNAKRFDHDHFTLTMQHLHRPFLEPEFELTHDYLAEGMRLNGPSSPNARTLAMPPAYLWVARLQWGLWSIVSRIHPPPTSYADILHESLSEPPRGLD